MAAAIRQVAEPAALAQFRQAVDKAARTLTWERESLQYVMLIETLGAGPHPAVESPQVRPEFAGE